MHEPVYDIHLYSVCNRYGRSRLVRGEQTWRLKSLHKHPAVLVKRSRNLHVPNLLDYVERVGKVSSSLLVDHELDLRR